MRNLLPFFAHSDFYSYKIVGVTNKPKKLHQLVSGNWPAGTTLYLSGWAKTAGLTTNGPVQAGVVILLETSSAFLRDQYIAVTVAGQGQAQIYQNGTVTGSVWKRDAALGNKLSFSDTNGKEIPLASGPIWIEVLTQ